MYYRAVFVLFGLISERKPLFKHSASSKTRITIQLCVKQLEVRGLRVQSFCVQNTLIWTPSDVQTPLLEYYI